MSETGFLSGLLTLPDSWDVLYSLKLARTIPWGQLEYIFRKLHYPDHKMSPLASVQNQINPVDILTPHYVKNYFYIFLLFTTRLPNGSFMFSNVVNSRLLQACYTPRSRNFLQPLLSYVLVFSFITCSWKSVFKQNNDKALWWNGKSSPHRNRTRICIRLLAEAPVVRLLFRCGNKSCIFIFNKMSSPQRAWRNNCVAIATRLCLCLSHTNCRILRSVRTNTHTNSGRRASYKFSREQEISDYKMRVI